MIHSDVVTVTWNGTDITGDIVLIYHEELYGSPGLSNITDPNGSGRLICTGTSETPTWRFTDGGSITFSTTGTFIQTRETDNRWTRVARNDNVHALPITNPDERSRTNGLWHCTVAETTVHVGVYSNSMGESN